MEENQSNPFLLEQLQELYDVVQSKSFKYICLDLNPFKSM